MKFIIETLVEGKETELELRDIQAVYWGSEVLDTNGESYRLSTARSIEAEAVKEAKELIVQLTDGSCNIGWGLLEKLNTWLEKWERD